MDKGSILYQKNYRLEEISEVALFIQSLIDQGKKNLVFTGDLGAGKTTLIKHLLLNLGIKVEVTSPTYTLVNEYERSNGRIVYHMDLYRLKSLEEALEIGIEEMLYDDDLCLIEWPQVISSLLPQSTIHIAIDHADIDTRKISIESIF